MHLLFKLFLGLILYLAISFVQRNHGMSQRELAENPLMFRRSEWNYVRNNIFL